MQTEHSAETHSAAADPVAAATSTSPQNSSLSATAPGQIRIIKRNGTVVPYDQSKIAIAVTKAFLAVEGGTAAASRRVHETVESIADMITTTFKRRMPSGGTIHIEEIQDQVELSLMRSGEHKVARDYVLYRESRAKLRAEKNKAQTLLTDHPSINVTMDDGSVQPLDDRPGIVVGLRHDRRDDDLHRRDPER